MTTWLVPETDRLSFAALASFAVCPPATVLAGFRNLAGFRDDRRLASRSRATSQLDVLAIATSTYVLATRR